MSDNYATEDREEEELADICRRHGLPAPVYETPDQPMAGFGHMTTVQIMSADGRRSVAQESAFGATAHESRREAARELVKRLSRGQGFANTIGIIQLLANTPADSPPPVVTDCPTGGQSPRGQPDGNGSVIAADDKADSGAKTVSNTESTNGKNFVGLLSELCTKQHYPQPKYTESGREGPAHCPVFTIVCELLANSRRLSTEGKARAKQAAKTLSAEEMLRVLTTGAPKGTPAGDGHESPVPSDLIGYFRTIGTDLVAVIDKCLADESLNYRHKLAKIGSHMACDVEYEPMAADGGYEVLLKVMVTRLAYPLVNVWARSAVTADHCQEIAAKKAVQMLKILVTED